KRLVREKEYAVHALAQALLEHGELIGDELDQVFQAADAANPDKATPFQRKVVALPRVFQGNVVDSGSWPAEPEPAAAAASAIRAPIVRSPIPVTVTPPASSRHWSPEQG